MIRSSSSYLISCNVNGISILSIYDAKIRPSTQHAAWECRPRQGYERDHAHLAIESLSAFKGSLTAQPGRMVQGARWRLPSVDIWRRAWW